MLSRCCRLLLVVLLLSHYGFAQQEDPARHFDAPNLLKQIGSMGIVPFFVDKQDKFWFAASDSTDRNYYYIDPAAKIRRNMSDRHEIAVLLKKLLRTTIDTALIKVEGTGVGNEGGVGVSYKGDRYVYEFLSGRLVASPPKTVKRGDWRTGLSPDKQWQLYSRAHNLYLRRCADSAEYQLSRDAALYYSFHINDDDTSSIRDSQSEANWIKGTSSFYVVREDRREVGTMSVVHTLTMPRPRLETYKYELPGDKHVKQFELFVGDTARKALQRVNIERWKDQEVEVVHAGSRIFFLRKKRTRDEIELCTVDPATAEVKVLVHEVSKPFINEDLFKVHVLNDGKDIVWWSDRSGWGHYYLYDGNGQLKQAITGGEWTAGKIAKIDTVNRKLYFYGYGQQPGVNPYYAFVYSVRFSGKDLRLLTPENATHNVFIGPGGKYMVDTYSRIDMPPRVVARSTEGKVIMDVWVPDVSRLYRYGWKHPEMFKIKAADGVTDIYGLMWKPFNFDATRKYPVISQVYPGPQTETVWSEFTVLDRYNNTSLAQNDFVVVCMGHRGGSPYRSKAYYAYGYDNLRDYALEDDIAGLRQLAARYSFIDTSRVGIFGHSGGGMMAVAAICTYPDFYKVAVASSGNHDNRIYNRTWGETYQGIDSSFRFQVKLNQDLARGLKGRLLLVTGEVDANVHPGNTYRMVNALILADKPFDMLVLPGQSHSYEGPYKSYYQQRLRSYFKQYL
ncbi:DPP IV N-terminal domain-containing protein [Chitinophaga sedimenti]|uniref:S9 family peptidase n=1 Tax=Chitinophaga sedimenti TaxID=2033606 RepID=UPI00200496B1|nr:DPP IV N-terminal domain-containing protein [Chitinophaga sedimenti]MCK7554694.1 DPP IV N-terminal domain-containing protein [Chitinophaga sedimenti]